MKPNSRKQPTTATTVSQSEPPEGSGVWSFMELQGFNDARVADGDAARRTIAAEERTQAQRADANERRHEPRRDGKGNRISVREFLRRQDVVEEIHEHGREIPAANEDHRAVLLLQRVLQQI